ncbi:hypothetical protein ASE12_02705 [Aeromicrobium sp. Root236]|nr:hypothetical protein ASE12_02705 [Aeromicrobium sp. Root236]
MLAVLAENQADVPLQQDVPAERPVASALQVATWDRVQVSPDVTVYLAADSAGVPVGTACLSILPNITYDCRPTAFIEAVVVAYAQRRRGVATLLLERVLADSRAAGCHKVQLLSHKRHAQDGAHALYTSAGFSPEAEGFRLYL